MGRSPSKASQSPPGSSALQVTGRGPPLLLSSGRGSARRGRSAWNPPPGSGRPRMSSGGSLPYVRSRLRAEGKAVGPPHRKEPDPRLRAPRARAGARSPPGPAPSSPPVFGHRIARRRHAF
ncbi:hypothetical protein NDU88_001185 [Pleurodeles waltl]|uniref:Uncharacterized protein n=1 Tax=Pleurodeles waltl TaxID=8319 RepID=A0AAV7SZL7_PLEWA|nr:hypothetical protein NDU88_001185 [Pleurodeles waltl]